MSFDDPSLLDFLDEIEVEGPEAPVNRYDEIIEKLTDELDAQKRMIYKLRQDLELAEKKLKEIPRLQREILALQTQVQREKADRIKAEHILRLSNQVSREFEQRFDFLWGFPKSESMLRQFRGRFPNEVSTTVWRS